MLTNDGRPICGSCGTIPPIRRRPIPAPDGNAWSLPPVPSRPYTTAEYEQTARAGGWRIGTLPGQVHDAMCPKCARPDRGLVKLCNELAASTRDHRKAAT